MTTPAVRISAKTAGFRRCGIAHTAEAVDHPAGRFSEAEVEILKNDPMLIVQEMAPPEKKPAPKKSAARKPTPKAEPPKADQPGDDKKDANT